MRDIPGLSVGYRVVQRREGLSDAWKADHTIPGQIVVPPPGASKIVVRYSSPLDIDLSKLPRTGYLQLVPTTHWPYTMANQNAAEAIPYPPMW